ncbi:diguanylate cyclase domain-containing protein [Jiella sonneratiae]|uniref:Diguanylate cyclase n=1 Tax=Jiella sonneratiae TaxID=2816856 RepID=A0ABS3J6F1_9HYPH|nr:diguanylate cyclase [Jiella sonneratiae]MBO0905235.1 diguanylate cyclase [Jiella sonneratiae]
MTAVLFLPVIASLLLTGSLVAFVVHWSTSQADAESIRRETMLVRELMDQRIARITKDQQSTTSWNDALKQALGPREPAWFDANLGIWMHDYFGIDRTFVLDGAGHSVYAMIDGHRDEPSSYFTHAAAIDPVVEELRAHRLRAQSATNAPTAIRRYVLLENRPAIVSAAAIVSDTGEIAQVLGKEPIHVAVEFLDGRFLAKLQTDFLLDHARFSWTGHLGPHEAAFPLKAEDTNLGYLVWTVRQPGTKIFEQMMPALGAAGAILVLLAGGLLFWIRQTTSRLARSQQQIEFMAHHDALTGLANRFSFQSRLEERMREFAQARRSFAVLYLDLDRFKAVNDTLGHQAGDELIRQAGERLSALVPGTEDMVARLGGDEFAVLRNQVGDRTEIESLSKRIIEIIQTPFELADRQVFIGVSIGAAIASGEMPAQFDLVRRADVALYRVKKSGRNGYIIFGENDIYLDFEWEEMRSYNSSRVIFR